MNPAARRVPAALLASLAMLGPFSIDTVFPAFPAMRDAFGVGDAAVQQSVSLYLAGFALMSLVHGPLSDARGRRPVVLIALGLFLLATVGAATANGFGMLLVWRFLQGCCGGAGMIVGRAVIRDCYAGAEAQRLMAQVNLIFGAAPALAPIVGGVIIAYSGWRAIFWALAGFAGLLLVVCLRVLPESHPPESRMPLDTTALLRTYRGVLGDRGFLLLAMTAACNFAALFVYIASAPAFVLGLLHLDVRQFGWLFVPAIAGLMSGSLLARRMSHHWPASRMVAVGYRFIGAGTAANLLLNLLLPQPLLPWSVLPIAIGAVGISIAFPTLTLLMLDRFPAMRGAAASLQAATALAMNTLVAALLAPAVSGHGWTLACAAALLSAAGYAFWQRFRRCDGRSERPQLAISAGTPA